MCGVITLLPFKKCVPELTLQICQHTHTLYDTTHTLIPDGVGGYN